MKIRAIFVLAATICAVLAVSVLVPMPQAQAEEGEYDNQHQWHDADWWHKKHPNWSNKHHPEWAKHHPEWRNDGDFDDQHHWHDRDWWVQNRGDWVREHHPDWWESRGRGASSSLLERRRTVELYLYNARAQYNDAVARGDHNRAKHLSNAIKADQEQLNSIDQQLQTYGGRPY